MMKADTASAEFFEEKYRADADPWKFQTSRYELGRYRAVLQALAGQHFRHAFEPGCSIGVLTEQLAMIADRVDACDFSQTASSQAAARCAHLKHVNVLCAGLNEEAAWQRYDLILLSEIGYYFSPGAWMSLTERMTRNALPGSTILAAHWLGESTDHAMSGDAVHEILHRDPRLEHTSARCATAGTDGFRLDVWRRKA